jgi:tRNA-specific 2-thiouridylase
MADLILPDLPPGSSVAVAMSGGVDSSVAAALLVEAGHRVVGIMLRLWAEPGAASSNKCCTLGAIDDARDVADHLGIPFSVLDAREAFYDAVVAPFLQASQAGDTPNPCFGCNRNMRFGWLLERAQALGADYLATGHYARVARDAAGAFQLLRGLDPAKDQSYMLHRLDQRQLAAAVFPVGVYPKPEVRRLAQRFGLSVAKRADSVDLCWTGEGGVAGFLDRHLPAEAMEAGPILHVDGRELGRHAGLPRYTIGQRRGLGIAGGVPLYVSGRDRQRNALLLGEAEDLDCRSLALTDMCWTAGKAPDGPCRVEAQIRYRAPAQAGELRPSADGQRATIRFDLPVRAAAPGQGLVAYLGDAVLGGGRIRMEEATEA